jgi:hypothetical protein
LERIIYPPLAEQNRLRQPLTAGEKRVLDLFNRRLPPEWEIYVQPHLNGLRPDFVLLNPNSGIAVFEVKDWNLGSMRYFTKKDEWGHYALWAEKDGREFSVQRNNPVSKVNLYKREIFDLYCPRLQRGNGWAAITEGVIFPFADSASVKNLLAPFIQQNDHPRYRPITGAQEIANGDIRSIFPEGERKNSIVMSEAHAADLRGWLAEPDFSSTQRTRLILDDDQRRIAETDPGKTGYRRLKGPAGSGKSLVLAARAARLANNQKSVLVATFNITLWHYLRDLIVRNLDSPGSINNIEFTHFHEWCKRLCHEVGWEERYNDLWAPLRVLEDRIRSYQLRFRQSPSQQLERELDFARKEYNQLKSKILDDELPALANEAINQPGARRYDALLLDEAQDYLPHWWSVLRKAHEPNGEVLFVADATQDIYDTARTWTDDVMKGAGFVGAWNQLKVSYRLPPKALSMARSFAEMLLPKDTVDLPEADQGALDLYPCRLRWVQCARRSANEVCFSEIESLMRLTGTKGLANADITLLASDMRSGAEIVSSLNARNIHVVDTFGGDNRRQKMGFYMGDARIKATTLHSFKGWESRLLVIYVGDAADRKSLALIYTGLTRLKRSQQGSWLTVVSSAPRLANFGQQFDEFVSLQ